MRKLLGLALILACTGPASAPGQDMEKIAPEAASLSQETLREMERSIGAGDFKKTGA